jgi:Fe-S cluster biogenesis protein NfuA
MTMCETCGCGETTEKTFQDKIAEVIESIRPALQSHGGDIELVSTDEQNNVNVRLQGACQGCPGARMTMTMGVERILRERVPEVKQVTAVD